MPNLITICARKGSKGIPQKNKIKINGIPLVQYSISAAKKFAHNFDADIILSTDDDEIKEIGKAMGCRSDYTRPAETATDTAGKLDAIKHALYWAENNYNKKYEYLLDLDVTSPLRTMDDLN